jgi:Replication initiation factor
MQPPACNTGVHPHSPPCRGFAESCRFDWYRATVPAHPELILEAVLSLADGLPSVETGKGRFNYQHALTVTVGGDRVATILHGGPNGHPNVEASGERAPALAELLRAASPEHRVTRCDVAIDLFGPDAFVRTERIAHAIAADSGLQLRKIASPLDRSAGETVYIGSRSSALFARIYEKGKAERTVYGDHATDELDSWVRCELEVKPQKDMKAQAATMPPEAFWGCSEWTARLAQEAFAMSPEPVPFHPRRTASDDRAWSFMAAQYRNLARRRLVDRYHGDRAALYRELDALWFDTVSADTAA